MLRFSRGMIPLGSLSCTNIKRVNPHGATTATSWAALFPPPPQWASGTELYSLWCTQSSTDSCRWGWTTSSSRFLLVPLWSRKRASKRLNKKRARERERERQRAPKHRVEQQTGRQMYGQTDRWRLLLPRTSPYHPDPLHYPPCTYHHHDCIAFSSLLHST